MRQVFDDRDAAGALGERAAGDIRARHSPQARGESSVAAPRVDPGDRRRGAASDAVAEHPRTLAACRCGRAGPGRGAGAGGAAARPCGRRSLRVMRPFTAYQQAVNADVAPRWPS